MKNFLNSIAGSWLKVFAVAIMVKFLDMGADVFALNAESLKHLLQAGIVAVVPVVINFLNPNDPRYGLNKN